jgi:two-component system cell cycle sensor histidine kinase/response regulator CckA
VIELSETLPDLGMLLRRLIGEKATLDIPLVRDLWQIRADVGQFEQAIINLAVNARDAMPNGGKLTIRTSNVSAEESVRLQRKGMPAGEYVKIEVADTGTGIAPDVIGKIFDPFYTTKDIGKGTGLGLATVYGFIKQTGGFIYVDSELDKGTTFRIFIPRYVPVTDDTTQPPEVAAPRLAGPMPPAKEEKRATTDLTGQGTILLVEDEEGLRALNARGLSSRGYTVVEAGNGVEAIDAIERRGGNIDLVVSDVMMPEMDGPTMFKELRKRHPDLKIIFVSGYAEDAFQKSLPDPEKYDFLPKPFTLKQLVAQVKETMGRPTAL